MTPPLHFVIVGNGVAGMEAAVALRAREPQAKITVVSEESDHFFSRTALMYVLAGQLRHQDTEPLERDAYARLSLERVRARAVGLDLAGRRLRLSGGQELPYDRLLLACGSRPRPAPWPGAQLAGVGHFVTLQDLAWLEAELHGGPNRGGPPPRPDAHLERSAPDSPYQSRPVAARRRGHLARQAVVVGGGLIGIEVVEVMLAAGLRPHFVVREEWFWPMAIDAAEGAWITQRLAGHGAQVHLGRGVVALEGQDGLVTGLRTDDGALLPADVVVVAIGVVPNTGWLAGAGLALEPSGGVRVGPDLSTSAPGVFAAGDCAAVPGADGRPRVEQLWYTARDQGRIAARAMLGDPVRYERGLPYNSAKLMDIEYTTVGEVWTGPAPDAAAWEWTLVEEGRVRSSTRICGRGDQVVGFNLLGRRWDHSVLARWIQERRDLAWVVQRLPQAAFDTELVPPLRVPADRLAQVRALARPPQG